ncbi:beta-ketoacyl synthase N-terminal-like domain-containing protein [Streptomyces sp. NPDC021093]|uniref:beta-ketoacyl synthase N-terminal-like domain-containing protein n=1 Tax=Streptomyces sp. NPDC021093 TaxID=3365112 RepID=UPI0037AFC3EF
MTARAAVRTAITGVGWAVAGPDFDPATELTGRGMRHKDRSTRFALRAARRTLEDAGLVGAPELDGAAVIVSSNFANLDPVCDSVATLAAGRSADLGPMRLPQLSGAVSAAWVALDHGMRGPNLTLSNGASSGLDAVASARNLIAAGRTTTVLVIGVEPDSPSVARLHRESAGTRWIDGAVGLVVESVPHAVGRGARIRAEIAGYGRADDEWSAVRAAGATGVRRLGKEPTARFGRCSGALGVVQCASIVEQISNEPALAVAGAGSGESDGTSVSALVLTPPSGRDT